MRFVRPSIWVEMFAFRINHLWSLFALQHKKQETPTIQKHQSKSYLLRRSKPLHPATARFSETISSNGFRKRSVWGFPSSTSLPLLITHCRWCKHILTNVTIDNINLWLPNCRSARGVNQRWRLCLTPGQASEREIFRLQYAKYGPWHAAPLWDGGVWPPATSDEK